jgi:uncharacterized protein YcfL
MDTIQKEKIELEIIEKEVETKEFFMSFSSKKRHFIIALLILFIPAYFIAKYSVAALIVHNFQKNAIGAHQSSVTNLPISILDVQALSILNNNYSAYALIKNPNKELIASDLKYTFHFFDASGEEMLATPEASTYILSGEQKYVVEPNVKLQKAPAKVTVAIVDPLWKKRLSIPNIIIRSGIPQAGDQTNPDGYFINSSFTNQSVYTLATVTVNAVVFGPGHKVIAVTQRVESTVNPGETRNYKMYWPLPIAANVQGNPQIIVEVNPFDPNNLK